VGPEEAPEGMEVAELEEIYAKSDYITIHAPKNKFTNNLINKENIAKCKDGFKIINVARGGIVNETDILEAIESGKCSGAALDVFSVEPPT
jgi:D-3-phosphoglycerate dehydrogenase